MKISIKLLLSVAVLFSIIVMPALCCAICSVSASGVNFGVYDVYDVNPTDSSGTVTITCDEVPPPLVTISIGLSPTSGGFNPRQMKNAAFTDLLSYNLYTRINMNNIWGDGTGGTNTVSKRVNRNKAWTATIFGRIFAGQDVSAGVYSDNLTVTITW